MYIHIYTYIYIYIYIHKYNLFSVGLLTESKFAEWLLCRSVISIELLYIFVGVIFGRRCSVNLLHIFRAPLCGST